MIEPKVGRHERVGPTVRWLFIASMVAACGASHVERVDVARVEPLPAPPVAVMLSAGDGGASVPDDARCLAPYQGGKTVDQAALRDVDTSAASAPEKGFTRGRIYFESQDWVSAAIAFRAVAFAAPDEDVGVYASQLYLEALNVLGSHGRPVCYDDMGSDVPLLHDLYCEGRRAKNVEQCNILDRIVVDIGRLRAQKLVEDADRGTDPTSYRRAAEGYLTLVRKWCMPEMMTTVRCDELAYNSAVAFLAAGDLDAAKRVRLILIDPKNRIKRGTTGDLVMKLACRIDAPQSAACH